MSYLINKEIYKKKSDIISRAQNIISVTNTGDEINGENYDFILGLLKTMTNGNIKLQMAFWELQSVNQYTVQHVSILKQMMGLKIFPFITQ